MGDWMFIFQLNNFARPRHNITKHTWRFSKIGKQTCLVENALNNLIRSFSIFSASWAHRMNYLTKKARTPLFMLEIDALG